MKKVRNGVVASILLLIFYFLINYISSGYEGVIWNFKKYWPYIIVIDAGFGIQIALYTHIRAFHQSCKSLTTSGISAGSMIACCFHHVTDIIPIAGIGLSFALTAYTEFFMLIGVLSSIIGILLMLSTIQENRLFEDSNILTKMMIVKYEDLKMPIVLFAILIALWRFLNLYVHPLI